MSMFLRMKDIPDFRIWLIGSGFKAHKTKGEYETHRFVKGDEYVLLYTKKVDNSFRAINSTGELLWMKYLKETNQ